MVVDVPMGDASPSEVAPATANVEVDGYIEEGGAPRATVGEVALMATDLAANYGLEAMKELVRSLGVPADEVGSSTKDMVEQIRIALDKGKPTRIVRSSSASNAAGSGVRSTDGGSPNEDQNSA